MKGGSSYRESHRGRDAALESPLTIHLTMTYMNGLERYLRAAGAPRKKIARRRRAKKKININVHMSVRPDQSKGDRPDD